MRVDEMVMGLRLPRRQEFLMPGASNGAKRLGVRQTSAALPLTSMDGWCRGHPSANTSDAFLTSRLLEFRLEPAVGTSQAAAILIQSMVHFHAPTQARRQVIRRIFSRFGHTARAFATLLAVLGGLGSVALPAADWPAENPGSEGDGLFRVGPEYKIDPDLTERGRPQGNTFQFAMRLADSKIFRGDDPTLDPKEKPVRVERRIYVYVPAAYQDGAKAPFLIIHDGPGQLPLVSRALDNLTASPDAVRRLPAFVAIAVENGGNDSKNSERGLEYDTMSDRLARFIHEEVLPAVVANPNIRAAYPHFALTENPWGRAVMGCSSGGAAALSMGWFRPDLFRRIAAYSGTFVDQQDDDAPEEAKFPLGAWEYHSAMKLIENSEKKPLRIFTHVSENDNRAKDLEETYHNWVMAGQRTAAAFQAKGYHHRYVFSQATGHCDRRVFEQTLADTLIWLWRGYRPE
jgi:enterochelin esterase family protein